MIVKVEPVSGKVGEVVSVMGRNLPMAVNETAMWMRSAERDREFRYVLDGNGEVVYDEETGEPVMEEVLTEGEAVAVVSANGSMVSGVP